MLKISSLLLVFWSLIGIFSCEVDAYSVSQVDIQMLKLHFLMTINSNCIQNEQGTHGKPLCATMAVFVRQLDYLLNNGEIALTELLIPVITQLNEEGPIIKDALRSSKEQIKVGKTNADDTDLLDLIKDVEEKLKKSGDSKELIKRYQKLLQLYHERLQQTKKS